MCVGSHHLHTHTHELLHAHLKDLALMVLGLATKGFPEGIRLPLLLDLLWLPAWSHHPSDMVGHVTLVTTTALHRPGGGAYAILLCQSALAQAKHIKYQCVAMDNKMAISIRAYLAIPDVRLCGRLQHKAVVGVEGRSRLLHLHCAGVQGGGALDLEQAGAVHIVGVTVKAVLEARGPSTLDMTGRNTRGATGDTSVATAVWGCSHTHSMDDHLPPEDLQKVLRLLVLDHAHLDRCPTVLVVQGHCVQGCSTALILGRGGDREGEDSLPR